MATSMVERGQGVEHGRACEGRDRQTEVSLGQHTRNRLVEIARERR